jgi:hypothetical protein
MEASKMILKTTEQLRNEISAVKKILKISGENTKIAKTIAKAGGAVRIASLVNDAGRHIVPR